MTINNVQRWVDSYDGWVEEGLAYSALEHTDPVSSSQWENHDDWAASLAVEAEETMKALRYFVEVWGGEPYLALDVASKLTCRESNALVALLRQADPDIAEVWAQAHASEDEEGDEHFGDPTPLFTGE